MTRSDFNRRTSNESGFNIFKRSACVIEPSEPMNLENLRWTDSYFLNVTTILGIPNRGSSCKKLSPYTARWRHDTTDGLHWQAICQFNPAHKLKKH